jgi:hypothetical protein
MPARRRTARLVLVAASAGATVTTGIAAAVTSQAALSVPGSGGPAAAVRGQADAAALADVTQLTRAADGKPYRVGGMYSAGSALTASVAR